MSVVPFYKTAANLISRSGLAQVCAPYTGGMGIIFTLHRVLEEDPTGFRPNRHLQVTTGFLDDVLTHIRDRGFEIISLTQAVTRIKAGTSEKPFCVFTLDDGYRDNLEHALPVFRRHGAPMTIFTCTGVLDGTALLWWEVLEAVLAKVDVIECDLHDAPWTMDVGDSEAKCDAAKQIAAYLQALPNEARARACVLHLAERYDVDPVEICKSLGANWDELKRAVKDPLLHIGAHTVSHPTLSRLSPDAVRAEIETGRTRLESELGIHVEHFAYPYGYKAACGKREFAIVSGMGFKSAVTTRPGVLMPVHAESLSALPRVSLNGHYQSLAMVDSLISGVPFFVGNGFRRVADPG